MNKPSLTHHWITAWNEVPALCSKTSSFSSFPEWNTESLSIFVCACLRCRTTEWGSACLYPVWFGTKYPKHLMWLCLDTSSQCIFSSSLEYWPWKCLVNDPSNHFFFSVLSVFLHCHGFFHYGRLQANYAWWSHYTTVGNMINPPPHLFQFVHFASSQVYAAFRCILKVDLPTIDGALWNIPPSAFSAPLWQTDVFLVQVMGLTFS